MVVFNELKDLVHEVLVAHLGTVGGKRLWQLLDIAHCSLPSFQNQLKVNGGEEAGFGGQGTDKTPMKRSASSCLLHGWVSRLNWLHFFFFFPLEDSIVFQE